MGTRRKKTNIMKSRSKKKKMIKMTSTTTTTPTPEAPPPPLSDDDLVRNWSDLPEPLLVSIFDRLSFSAPDLAAVTAVSRPWRSAAAAASRGPPLLLKPVISLPLRRRLRWDHPRRCLLQTLVDPQQPYHRSPLSPQTLAKSCIGSSNSNLIFVDGPVAVLSDAFSGREIRSPAFPSESFQFSFGILTAPLASPSCLLLLVALDTASDVYSILCWRPCSDRWSVLELERSPEIMSLVVFKGQIFGLDSLYRLVIVEFDPTISWRLLEAQISTERFMYNNYGKFCQHLFECDGDLLVVLFVPTGKFWMPGPPKIAVFKLDLEKCMWVKKESLGDKCLFVDAVGKCGFSGMNPSIWRGRKNCVYVAGPAYDGWTVFPLDDEAIDTSDDTPLRSCYMTLARWPSPVWVYPKLVIERSHRKENVRWNYF